MAINLKQIFNTDTDNIKLDKVNYYFDQLIANGGGPQGLIGPKGDTGYQGVTGSQGYQGIVGNVGPQGNAGLDGEISWESIIPVLSTDAVTLRPLHNTASLIPPVVKKEVIL